MSRRRFSFGFIISFSLCVLLGALASGQQPSKQGPAPSTCEQAMRENTAYRDRIASMERQADAQEEELRTFMLRGAQWQDAYFASNRLANDYRSLLLEERDRTHRQQVTINELSAQISELKRELEVARREVEK